jgi:signal transduction histidine kinase
VTRRTAAPADAELIVAASQAEARQHVLSGLLHDLNGPLNNLGLTLALLERTLTPWLATQAAGELGERVRRYIASLTADTSRLGSWSRAASTAVHPSLNAELTTVAELRERIHRLLRHHATIAEVRLALDPAQGGDTSLADGGGVTGGLLSLVVAAIALVDVGGSVTLTGDGPGAATTVRIVIDPARTSSALTRAFAPTPVSPSSHLERHLLAGRLQIESVGGQVSKRVDGARVVLDVALRAA